MVLKSKEFDMNGAHYKISQKNFMDCADIQEEYLDELKLDKDSIKKMKRSQSSKLMLKTYLIQPEPTEDFLKTLSDAEFGKIITEINLLNESQPSGDTKDF